MTEKKTGVVVHGTPRHPPGRHWHTRCSCCGPVAGEAQTIKPSARIALRAKAAAALLCVGAAQAQPVADVKPEATLPTVRVTGQQADETATDPVDGYTARRSATATRTDTPLNEVPQSISVITADQVRDQNAQNMQEVLRYSAGVRAEMYGLDNRGDWFTLRGGSEGSTLLDGLRLPLTGWWGTVRNEPYAFERIEVLRGPASVVAGQNGPGGVVNLVSKRPQAEPLREIAVQLGNHNHKQLATDLTGPLNAEGTLLYRVVALGKNSDTQVEHAFDEREFLAPSLTWRPGEGTSLTVYAEYQRDESGNIQGFFPWSGTLLPAPNGPIPYDTFVGEPDWDTYGGRRYRMGYDLEQRLTEVWTLRHRLRHDRVEGKLRTMYADWGAGFVDAAGNADPDGEYLNRAWYANDDDGRITNADLLFERKFGAGSTRHTLVFGVDAMSARNDQKSWDGTATPLNVYDPAYGSFPLPALEDQTPVRYQTRSFGVFVQDQIKFGSQWVLVGALRHDRAKTSTTFEGVETSSDDKAWSKNLGLVYLTDSGWSPYASYSESFEPISDTDAPGNFFSPRRGKQLEAGVKWAPADQRVTASAAVYTLEETGRLAPHPTDPNLQVQLGEVTVKGLELEANAGFSAWDVLASYTYTDARNEATQARLHSIPEHSAALWALHKFGRYGLPGLRVGLGVRYVGETWDGSDTLAVPSNTLFDALVAYEHGAWRYALNMSNLTDKTYIATCLERGDCWFGTKRKAVLSAAYRW